MTYTFLDLSIYSDFGHLRALCREVLLLLRRLLPPELLLELLRLERFLLLREDLLERRLCPLRL